MSVGRYPPSSFRSHRYRDNNHNNSVGLTSYLASVPHPHSSDQYRRGHTDLPVSAYPHYTSSSDRHYRGNEPTPSAYHRSSSSSRSHRDRDGNHNHNNVGPTSYLASATHPHPSDHYKRGHTDLPVSAYPRYTSSSDRYYRGSDPTTRTYPRTETRPHTRQTSDTFFEPSRSRSGADRRDRDYARSGSNRRDPDSRTTQNG